MDEDSEEIEMEVEDSEEMEMEVEDSEEMEMEIDEEAQELFKPENKGFFSLLIESFKFFTLNLPAIATIVIPVFLVVEFLVPLLEGLIPNFADDLTGYESINEIFNWIIKQIILALISAIISAIAWIAVIRVIAAAMHGENLPPIQAMKDGTSMLPMYFVTAVFYHVLVIVGFIFLLVPGIILAVYFAFWQYSYVLRGHGAFSSLKYSANLVHGDVVRVFLNIFGIWVIMYVLNHYVIGLIAGLVAGNVDPDEGLVYAIVNATFMGLGKVFEGIRIIFLMTLFMDLEND